MWYITAKNKASCVQIWRSQFKDLNTYVVMEWQMGFLKLARTYYLTEDAVQIHECLFDLPGIFFSFFLYVFKKKTRWPMFFLLTCEKVGNNSGRQSNGRVLVPLDTGHFPLYLWTFVFSNGQFSKTSVPQQWKPSVLLRAICTFLHMWCLWAVILRGSFMCDKMSRCNSILYLLPELKAKKALLMCDY